jgi:hypothetical protein
LLTGEGTITEEGATLRDGVETETSRLSTAPYEALVDDDAAELAELAGGLTRTILAAGAFPDGVFASGSDRAPASR